MKITQNLIDKVVASFLKEHKDSPEHVVHTELCDLIESIVVYCGGEVVNQGFGWSERNKDNEDA